ncbi:GPI-N-acetylgalactosamine transferase PGAP4-like [Saccoglossus kowalevskii]|uniref:Transmembrane protein 246-like n=1 Tax=Saccoglossus kowalevskii TaxID=10224 RepID=A0ABM0GW35_SACKO|nr:PREDICTED: transmembrane protein 246-like [Saccoglossus kowalevskii]
MYWKCLPQRSIWRTFRHLLVTLVLYYLTFFVVLPIFCKDLPFSYYYSRTERLDENVRQAMNWNEQRLHKEESHLRSLDAEKTFQEYGETKENIHIAVGIVTVSRVYNTYDGTNPKYLTQVVSRVHRSIKKHRRGHKNVVFICNVNSPSQDHAEAMELATYFPVVHKYGTTNVRLTKEWMPSLVFHKEQEDYLFCLNFSRKYDAKYVVLLQDDAMPHDDFYAKLLYILENRVEMRYSRGELVANTEKWSWLKMNFPTPSAGFFSNWLFTIEGVALSLIPASITALIYDICYRQSNRISLCFTYYIFIISFVYFGATAASIGRPFFLPYLYSSVHLSAIRPGTSCCIAAVVYPSASLSQIVDYLADVDCRAWYPLDFCLYDFLETSGMKQYLAVPNIFTHIGMVSSLHNRAVVFPAFHAPL